MSLAVTLRRKARNTTHFARLKLPRPRWLEVPPDPQVQPGADRLDLIPIEQVVTAFVDELFPGMEVLAVHPFRVTRNADLRRDEEEAEDLLEMISAELRERRFAPVVRLEVDKDMPAGDRQLLMRELDLQPQDVYEVDGLLDLTGLYRIAGIPRPHLRDEPWPSVLPPRLQHDGES